MSRLSKDRAMLASLFAVSSIMSGLHFGTVGYFIPFIVAGLYLAMVIVDNVISGNSPLYRIEF